jgi:hypothetical protein
MSLSGSKRLLLLHTPGAGVGGYLGPVATGVLVPDRVATNVKQMMNRTRHRAVVEITALRVALPNFFIAVNGTETGSGGISTVTASVEYPAGVFTQLKFSGNASGTIADDAYTISDEVSVAIPKDAYFFIRWWCSNPAGVVYQVSTSPGLCFDSANGEAMTYHATTVTDQTMGGTVVATAQTITRPLAILGRTTAKTVCILGDSRALGLTDSFSAAGAQQTMIGSVARGIGQSFGYIQLARQGATLSAWLTHNTKQLALAAYCSHIVNEFGINDLNGGSSPATLLSNIAAMRALFAASKPFFQTTLSPWATSTDSYATLANQTTASLNANRVSVNTSIRAGLPDVAAFFDIASITESSLNSGKWIVNGAANYATPDGIHETQAANVLVGSGIDWSAPILAA